MGTLTLLVLVLAFTSATVAKSKVQFTRFRSWNSRMYPVWRDGDSRFRNCWLGGEVTFDLRNDAPTLTGAKATFNIDLHFPNNQSVLPDGQVVWARNCTVDGREYAEGQAVYADRNSSDRGVGVFPDGSPFNKTQDKRPRYVFVWKTWGRFWQVADGPSSSLTVDTDNIPLGSYKMEVVIYHSRGKDQFIPLGYASTQFSITDQIPFTISLNQISDVNQNDQSFIQNRAVAFNVNLHDPSQYLGSSDITFNWDFGDQTGTLISRELSVTHTYLAPGAYKPKVVLMASIPTSCGDTTAVVPVDPSAAPVVVVLASTPSTIPAETPSALAPEGEVLATEASLAEDLALAASVQPAQGTDLAADTEAEAAVAPAAEGGADVTVAPAAGEAVEVVVVPAAGEAVEVVVVPAAEEAVEATVAPAAEEAVEVAVVPAAGEAVEVVVVPGDEEAVEAAVAPAAGEAVEATVAPAAGEAVEATVVPAAGEAVEATVAPAAGEAVEATVAPAAGEAVVVVVAPADETAVVTNAAIVVVDDVPVEAEDAQVAEAATAAPVEEEAAEQEEAVAVVTEAAPADNVLVPAATESPEVVVEVAPAVDAEAEVAEAANEVAVPTVVLNEGEVPVEVAAEVEVTAENEPAQVALVLTKRQAPEPPAGCNVFRYGSLATSVEIIQGIESVEILQVSNVVSLTTELGQNAVDLTISCQGSLPSEVCTVVSEADCVTPVETVCAAALPSPDCQLVLRQFFNGSGVFCVNVSLANDVSLAVASARVSVTVGSSGSPAGTAATVLGVMVLVGIVGTIALMYRRVKQYQPLREESDGSRAPTITLVPLLLWNLLSRQSPGESRPLLQGRGV